MLVICFKPDLVMPIHAGVVDPLITLKVNHSTHEIITEEAIRENHLFALSAKLFSES